MCVGVATGTKLHKTEIFSAANGRSHGTAAEWMDFVEFGGSSVEVSTATIKESKKEHHFSKNLIMQAFRQWCFQSISWWHAISLILWGPAQCLKACCTPYHKLGAEMVFEYIFLS